MDFELCTLNCGFGIGFALTFAEALALEMSRAVTLVLEQADAKQPSKFD